MYKVFIDHKPILFIRKKELSTDHPSIEYRSKDALRLALRTAMKPVDIANPLQIICDDPKVAFKEFFANYKKIKAAGGIVKRKNKFLIIKRNGLWDIPKGKIDRGEKKEIAAVREIAEECGIDGHEIVVPITITYHTMKYKGRRALKKTFWYLLSYNGTKETRPEVQEGITKIKWVSYDELLDIKGKTYGSINHLLDVFHEKYPQFEDIL